MGSKGDLRPMASMSVPTKAILMYRAPIEGQVKKRLARFIGDSAALALYRWMGTRQLKAIPRDWMVETRFTPDCERIRTEEWLGSRPRYVAQGAGDLGERMRRAAKTSFESGDSQKVIFLGADCLALDEMILAKADSVLNEKDFVVGPALDGGYYLLGMRRGDLNVFDGVNWGSSTVFAETVGRIQSRGASIKLLETLADVDDWDSLQQEKARIDPDVLRESGLD